MRYVGRGLRFGLMGIMLVGRAIAAEPPQATDVKNFLVDKAKLAGKEVTVSGTPACIGGSMCYLYGDNLMQSVLFKPDALPRADRLRLLDCNPYTSPCSIIITGKVTADMFSEINVSSIVWLGDDKQGS